MRNSTCLPIDGNNKSFLSSLVTFTIVTCFSVSIKSFFASVIFDSLKTRQKNSRSIVWTMFWRLSYYCQNVTTSQEGFEPPTVRLEGECSIRLSY